MKTVLFSLLIFFFFSCENVEEKNQGKANNLVVADTIPGTASVAGINCFNDYDAGLAFAKQVKKPILLNFTGWAVVNSRKMEDRIWVHPEINPILKNDYVVISLYVDDKTPLPKEQQYKSSFGKDIVNIGQKWMDLEVTRFKSATQPLYVILDSNEKNLLGQSAIHQTLIFIPVF